MPEAYTFFAQEGPPPVYAAYRGTPASGAQELVGYVFLTSDLPPEEFAYSGPINVLVGMNLEGTITGINVLSYNEALSRIYGDFLRIPGFQEQFAGKHISDPFRVYRDVAGITRATITVAAMSRGIRNSARRVAQAYLQKVKGSAAPDQPVGSAGEALERLDRLTWPEMLSNGLVTNIALSNDNLVGHIFSFAYAGSANLTGLDLFFTYVGNEALGRLLLGTNTFTRALSEAGPRAQDAHLMLVGLDGTFMNLFDPERLAIRQGTMTFPLSRNDFIFLGQPWEGKIANQVRFVGVFLIDREVDIRQPFTILYDIRPAMGLYSSEYAPPVEVLTLLRDEPNQKPAPAAEAVARSAPVDAAAPELSFSDIEEETVWSRLLLGTSWNRVAALLFLFGMVMYAFLRKNTIVRWVALACTLIYLGFIDGGFLSVSHIISGINVGPLVFFNGLPLLLMVGFAVTTTLLWGRLFCGFLCPFGVLQDILERIVPRRFQRKIPQRIHDLALYIKYGILSVIVTLAVVGSYISIYQYFEPFGTVFYFSPSALLWLIAIGVLVASAIVPRFYCRYVCPLGAAFGLASLLAPFRIKQVDQCNFCKVCELKCPVRAIRGSKIDFKECVRCDICEVKLLTLAGVCRHTMEEVRARLKDMTGSPYPGWGVR